MPTQALSSEEFYIRSYYHCTLNALARVHPRFSGTIKTPFQRILVIIPVSLRGSAGLPLYAAGDSRFGNLGACTGPFVCTESLLRRTGTITSPTRCRPPYPTAGAIDGHSVNPCRGLVWTNCKDSGPILSPIHHQRWSGGEDGFYHKLSAVRSP